MHKEVTIHMWSHSALQCRIRCTTAAITESKHTLPGFTVNLTLHLTCMYECEHLWRRGGVCVCVWDIQMYWLCYVCFLQCSGVKNGVRRQMWKGSAKCLPFGSCGSVCASFVLLGPFWPLSAPLAWKVLSDDAHTACNSITDETLIHIYTHTHTDTLGMLPALLIRCCQHPDTALPWTQIHTNRNYTNKP